MLDTLATAHQQGYEHGLIVGAIAGAMVAGFFVVMALSLAMAAKQGDAALKRPVDRRRGLQLLGVLLVTVTASCVSSTAPDPCINPGDTVGVVQRYRQGELVECIWILAERRVCFDEPIVRQRLWCVVTAGAR